MADNSFGWDSFGFRFLFAVIVVFATWNPEGYSWVDWMLYQFAQGELSTMTLFMAFTGIVLLIGWVMLIRATLGSLGAFGIILAVAFFGLLIWLIIDVLGLPTDSFKVISYIVQIMIAAVLSIGSSWSHVRRRFSGQVDTDEVER